MVVKHWKYLAVQKQIKTKNSFSLDQKMCHWTNAGPWKDTPVTAYMDIITYYFMDSVTWTDMLLGHIK